MLDALGNIGDFVGGLAVVVTLVYLAAQIRQNTNALHTASRQAISDGYREANRLRLAPESALAWARGLHGYEDLSFADAAMFTTLLNEEALFFQGAYAMYESGQLDESTYLAYLGWFSSVIFTPGGSHWWENVARPIYTPGMIVAVDDRIAEGGLVDVRELPGFRLDANGAG